MCGICGFAGFEDPALLKQMNAAQAHRGPDSEGYFHAPNASLAMRRLSIIDLSTGDQPIFNEDNSVAVVFNGEIYNYPELKEKLIKNGHVFATQTDTEVIVHLYEDMGEDFPTVLKGMFAIALWDKKSEKLVLVRDQVGIKPLHYHLASKNRLVFASEIKSILKFSEYTPKTNGQALHFLMNLRYVPGERTLFSGVKRLLPGHLMVWRPDGMKIRQYHAFDFSIDQTRSEQDWMDAIHHALARAVDRHTISHVPLGVFLSGGLDSSAITAYLAATGHKEISTFTLGFNQKSDENADAALVARHFNTSHRSTYVSADPLQRLPRVIHFMEEPKVNQLQGLLLSQYVRKYVKVALSGLGGDELFGGYISNRFIQLGNFITKAWKPGLGPGGKRLARTLARLDLNHGDLRFNEHRRGLQMLLSTGSPEDFYLILRNAWDMDPPMWKKVYAKSYDFRDIAPTSQFFRPLFGQSDLDFLETCLKAEFLYKMTDDFLVNEDRTSMANSLEARVPLLDLDLVSLVLKMPGNLKVKGFQLKYLFKRLLAPVLPKKTLTKKKWGFAFSSYEQYKKDLRQTAFQVLTPGRIQEVGIFNPAYIQSILNAPASPRLRWHYFYLWLLVGFDIWHRIFIEGSPRAQDDLSRFYAKGA